MKFLVNNIAHHADGNLHFLADNLVGRGMVKCCGEGIIRFNVYYAKKKSSKLERKTTVSDSWLAAVPFLNNSSLTEFIITFLVELKQVT